MTDAAPTPPTAFVLFGATGDLARRMVLPAFAALAGAGLLPEQWRLIGNGRGHRTDEEFREHVRGVLDEAGSDLDDEAWASLADNLRFAGGGFSSDDPGELPGVVDAVREELGGDVQLVHYLALPPSTFEPYTRALREAGLAEGARVVYEKPYGTSAESFESLDELVLSVFEESQVFRIDHFLGKEATQQLHVLRFANRLFEQVWSRDHVAAVQIDVPETLDVADRAEFYDETGATLDMLVTHLLQVAAEVAMEPPAGPDPQSLQDARESVLAAFRPIDAADVVLGQAEGYQDLPEVADSSSTDTFVAARDTILDIVPLPGGGGVYSADDPGWGRIGADGRILFRPDPPLLDMRPSRDRLAVSRDGLTVEVATGEGLQHFDAAAGRLRAARRPDDKLTAARTAAAGLALSNWRDSSAPRLNGVALALDRSELSRSAAILPGDQAVLLGTDTSLRLFGRDGAVLASAPIPAAAWSVGVSGDGKVAVAALLDGTLRWYDLDGAPRLTERGTLFAQPAQDRWVLYTPEGLFEHGEGGGQTLVGVHLNRGRNQQPEWVSFSQAYRPLFAPAAVLARLRGDPTPARQRLAELGDLRQRFARQPSVTVASACLSLPDGSCTPLTLEKGGATRLPPTAAPAIRLTLQVADRGLGVGPIDVFVNGRNAGRSAAPVLQDKSGTATLEVGLDPGDDTVQARVYDGSKTIFTESGTLRFAATPPPGTTQGRGRLFVLAVGIDHFQQPDFKLSFAVADARSFAEVMRTAGAGLFSAVQVTSLTDAEATRAGILEALDRVARQANPEDSFVFYAATHGIRNDADGRFLMVPYDEAAPTSMDALARSALEETALVAALSRIRARNGLLLMDTCYSGQLTAENMANVGHETGRYLLAASTSLQEALDSYDSRNGVFLYAVREGMSGKAGRDGDGVISALALGEYVSQRVGVLAREKGHEQDAVFRTAQRDLRSFPLGKVVQ